MRVLVVSSWAPWLDDGASLVLDEHLRVLAPEHEVRMLVPDPGIPARGARQLDGVPIRSFARRLPGPIDYVARRIRSELQREPAHVFWVERPGLVAAIERELAEFKPDVLHLHGWGTAQLSRLAGAVPSLHVSIDAWGLGRATWLKESWRRFSDAGQQSKVEAHERRHYPRCGAVVLVAELDAEYVRSRVPNARVEIVPNGVHAGPEPPPKTHEPVIGFHGVLSSPPNRDAAVFLTREVLPRVRERVPGARLLLIGRDPAPEVHALAGDGVELTGSVADVREPLARVGVYVAAMQSGTGIKNKVLEAMAAGLPVVATPNALGGIGEGPGIVVARDAGEIAARTAELLTAPEERGALGRAARQRVLADFTWERSARSIESLWRELAARR